MNTLIKENNLDQSRVSVINKEGPTIRFNSYINNSNISKQQIASVNNLKITFNGQSVGKSVDTRAAKSISINKKINFKYGESEPRPSSPISKIY